MKVIEITTFLGLPLAAVLTGCTSKTQQATVSDVQAAGDDVPETTVQQVQNEATTADESLKSNDDVWLDFFRQCYNDHFGTDLTPDESWDEPGTFTAAKLQRDGLSLDLTQPAFNKTMADLWRRWMFVKDDKYVNDTDLEYKKKDGEIIRLEAKTKVNAKRTASTKQRLAKAFEANKRARSQRRIANGGTMALDTPAPHNQENF